MTKATRAIQLARLEDVTLPLDGYIRVSRVGARKGEAGYISPDLQANGLKRWGEDHNQVVHVHEPEENVSGGTMDRPVFNEIMRRIRDGESGGIIVYTLDRFARTLVGGLSSLEEIAKHNGFFTAVSEPDFDLSNATARLMFDFQLRLAQYFRERATEAWEAALTHAVGRGVHIAPGDAYGYIKHKSRPYEVDEERAPFAAEAFQRRARGATWQSIADYLNAEAPPRLDERAWVMNTVSRMLKRRIYLGHAHWGDQENLNAHPRIVEDDVWHEAQRIVQTYSKKLQHADEALLHGITRCAGCRFTMSRALNTSGGRKRYYYRCRVQRVSGTCCAPASVRGDLEDGLETYVENVVIAELERGAAQYVAEEDSGALDEALTLLHVAEDRYERTRRDTELLDLIGRADWLDMLSAHKEAVENAQAAVDELRDSSGPTIKGLTADEYRAMPRAQRAEVLRALIDVVFVRSVGGTRGRYAVPIDANRVRILWRGQGPADLPSSNRVSQMIPWTWPEN